MAPKHKFAPSRNPLHFRASSSSDPTPSSTRFRDKDARKDFSEKFSRRGVHSKRQVILSDFSDTDLPTVIHSRGWESLCDVSVTCPTVLIQEFYSNMHGLDYSVPLFSYSCSRYKQSGHTRVGIRCALSCERLRTMSKDELISAFRKCPSNWGDHQFTPCSIFAKGPRFMNMVMTFVFHPLSHYNSITKPRVQFLLSLLEHLTVDFPSHFILSIIDVYKDTATRDKLIFPSAITWILHHFSVPFPVSGHFHVMCAIDTATVK